MATRNLGFIVRLEPEALTVWFRANCIKLLCHLQRDQNRKKYINHLVVDVRPTEDGAQPPECPAIKVGLPPTWGLFFHLRKLPIHLWRLTIHERSLSIRMWKLLFHVRKLFIYLWRLTIHERSLSIHTWKLLFHVGKLFIHLWRLTIHEKSLSIHTRKLLFHARSCSFT
jgi:hypothetical protein